MVGGIFVLWVNQRSHAFLYYGIDGTSDLRLIIKLQSQNFTAQSTFCTASVTVPCSVRMHLDYCSIVHTLFTLATHHQRTRTPTTLQLF